MVVQIELELQLHSFQASKNENFAFIPYGLEKGLSKEAVKVHVLHGRKRQRNQNQKRAVDLGQTGVGQQNGSLQGQEQGRMFSWDSKVKAPSQKKHKQTKVVPAQQQCVGVGKDVASLAQSSRMRHNLHHFDVRLSLDDQLLHNPFVERLRDGFGNASPSRIESSNYLVDHYLSRCGQSRFPRELLASYWQDSAAFKAFLAHAATLFTLETGLLPPVNVEELMCSALQEIRTRVADPIQRHSDGTVLAVAILANVEEGRSHTEDAAWHWRGLKQLLRLRGDFFALRWHRDLHTMLLWREIMTSNSRDFCFGHGFDERPKLQYCSQHIVTFFQNFADRLTEDNDYNQSDTKDQLFLAMKLSRNIGRTCEWTISMNRRSEIACLLYLSILALSASRSQETRKIMQGIRDDVVEREKWGQVSQEELLFIMLRHGNVLDNEWRCQQLWQLSRCIYVTRCLDVQEWKTIRDILSLFLGLEDGCESRKEVLEAWESLSKRLLLGDGCHAELGASHATGWAS